MMYDLLRSFSDSEISYIILCNDCKKIYYALIDAKIGFKYFALKYYLLMTVKWKIEDFVPSLLRENEKNRSFSILQHSTFTLANVQKKTSYSQAT